MIAVFVADRKEYNRGILVGQWLDLPCQLASLPMPKGGYILADYEAPFEVGEDDDLVRLNGIAMKLEEVQQHLTMEQITSALQVMDIDALLRSYEEMKFVRGTEYHDLGYALADVDSSGVPEFFARYFDFASYGKDLVSGGEYMEAPGFFIQTCW